VTTRIDPITFQVEDCLYRIHRFYLVTESSFFRDMLSLPNTGSEGQSDDNPIFLHQTNRMEFDSLLEYFYFGCASLTRTRSVTPQYMLPHSQKATYKPSEEAWAAILSVSKRLLFDEVHQQATEELTRRLDTMDPIQQLLIAQKHSITEWRVPAYVKLVERPDRLTLEDAEKLPLADVLAIANCREIYHHRDNCPVGFIPVPAFGQSAFGQFGQFKLPLQPQARVRQSALSIIRRQLGELIPASPPVVPYVFRNSHLGTLTEIFLNRIGRTAWQMIHKSSRHSSVD
jgi:BTB/POZ domain